MGNPEVSALIDEATFEFTMGAHDRAIELLDLAIAREPESFDAWLAKTEVHFDLNELDLALAAAEKALALCPNDTHVNTSLSRIWMECGDKEKAEHFGAQARILGWKVDLQNDPSHK